jgi:hypothetical protein
MTMHLAGRRSAAGKPSPGKSHLLRHSQLAAGVPDAIVSHTKGHADVRFSFDFSHLNQITKLDKGVT